MTKIWPLPKVNFTQLSQVEEKRPVALLTSETVWTQVGHLLNLPLVVQAEPMQEDRELIDHLATNLPSQTEAIYAVGTGVPVVAGKMVAHANNLPLVVVPTSLSGDELFESFVQFLNDGLLTRVETGAASEVVIEWEIIQAAPRHERAAAIADVLAIVTAMLDWRYAATKQRNNPEHKFSAWGASVAAGLASQAIKSAKAIGDGSIDALRTLVDLLMMSVQLAHQLGHDRHQEGTEHYFAFSLQNQGASFLHSEGVGPGILFASALHGQDPSALRDALENAGVRLNQLRSSDVRLAVNDLAAFVTTNNLPYSYAHDLDALSDEVQSALEKAGLHIDDNEAGGWDDPASGDEETVATTIASENPTVSSEAADTLPTDATTSVDNVDQSESSPEQPE